MSYVKTKIGDGGRLVIPAEQRKALGLNPGDTVLLSVENGELRLRSLQESIRRARSLVAKYTGPGGDGRLLSEEFIAERRREAERE
jgi:AbrB family looped-hinge helix DNA binding protein